MTQNAVVDILTDRHFDTAEEELMMILGWDSVVNLWRVYEAVEEQARICKNCEKFDQPVGLDTIAAGICREGMFGDCDVSHENELACEHFDERGG